MKKTKIIVPALGMLLLSTAASVTGTVAWFSSNQIVTASGMQVKAKAQAGLVISNASDGTYNVSAASAKSDCAELYPASTKDLSTWLTSTSTNPGQANTQQTYTSATAWTDTLTDAHYVVHDFFIRSSAAAALTVTSLDVKSVTVTESGGDSTFDELSKSLRVGIKFGTSTNAYIYAPVSGYTASYSVQNAAGAYTSDTSARTTVTPVAGNTVSRDTSVTSIPANSGNGLHAYVYVWFEGEDAACISNNIISGLETLSISVEFTYNSPAA